MSSALPAVSQTASQSSTSQSLSALLSSSLPLLPLKREFMNPAGRYASLIASNVSDVKVIEGDVSSKWDILNYNKQKLFDWYFAPNNESHNITVAAVTTTTAYELGDDLLQYFTEMDIFNIKKRKYPSVAEFYAKNFATVQAKAQELKNADTSMKMADRFYLNEALYKMPEVKRIKPMRISTALAIFRYFESKVIFDPVCDFGSRMIAASISGATVYHGLNPKGYSYARELETFLNKPNFHISGEGIDIFTPNVVEDNAYDTIFTNLIFFEEDEENKKKYRDDNDWLHRYAFTFITNSVKALVKNGYFMLYYSDHRFTKYMKPIAEYCVERLRLTFLGVIAVTKDDLEFANVIFVWLK